MAHRVNDATLKPENYTTPGDATFGRRCCELFEGFAGSFPFGKFEDVDDFASDPELASDIPSAVVSSAVVVSGEVVRGFEGKVSIYPVEDP